MMWITAVIEKLLVPTVVTNNPKLMLIDDIVVDGNFEPRNAFWYTRWEDIFNAMRFLFILRQNSPSLDVNLY